MKPRVIAQPAPVMDIEAPPVVQDDETTDGGTHPSEGPRPEPKEFAQSVPDGGFWNFEVEDVEN